MKKICKFFAVSFIICSTIVTPANAAPSISDLEKEKAAAENEVGSLRAELTELLGKINQLEIDLIAKGQEIEQASSDLKAAEEKEAKQYADMKLRIKYMYEEGNTSFLEALFRADDFADFINKAEYVKNVNTYDRDMLNQYIDTKEQVSTMKVSLEEESSQLELLQGEYHKEEAALNDTIQTKQTEIANFDAEIQAAAEAAAREAAAREAAEREAREAEARNAAERNKIPTSNGRENDDSDGGGSYHSSGNTGTAGTIISAAYSYLGVPYNWGGASRSGIDCSGLVMLAHQAAGINLSHSSGGQGGGGVAVSDPQPGDVVCYPGHVGIYIGGGQMIHAPQPGDVVKVQSVYGSPWYRRYW